MAVIILSLIIVCLLANPTTPACSKCGKKHIKSVKIGFNGPDVLTLDQFEDMYLNKDMVGVYNIQVKDGRMFEHYNLKMKQTHRPTDPRYTLWRVLNYNFKRNNLSACVGRNGTSFPYFKNSTKAIYQIKRTVGGVPGNIPLEIQFSSCPERYLWSLVCSNFQVSNSTCPEPDLAVMLKVPAVEEGSNVSPLDDLPFEYVARDISRNTNLKFGKMSNLRTIFLQDKIQCTNFVFP